MRHLKTISALSAAALLWMSPGAFGEEPDQAYAPPNPAEQRQQQAPVTDAKLEQFSDALINVRSVQEDYAEQIRAADSMDKAQSLRESAQEDMVGAVEDSGLSVSEYNLISQRLQNDQELVQRLRTMLE